MVVGQHCEGMAPMMFGGVGKADWRRSSYCPSGSCVEVRYDSTVILVRNTQAPGQNLRIDRDQWLAFVEAVKAGEFASGHLPG